MGAHFPISQVAAALEVGCTIEMGRFEKLGGLDERIHQTLIYLYRISIYVSVSICKYIYIYKCIYTIYTYTFG